MNYMIKRRKNSELPYDETSFCIPCLYPDTPVLIFTLLF